MYYGQRQGTSIRTVVVNVFLITPLQVYILYI